MEDIGQTSTSSAFARYEITDGNPLSAALTTGYDVELARNDTTVFHRSTGRMTCDEKHFFVEVTLAVGENDETLFAREWKERFPRDHV